MAAKKAIYDAFDEKLKSSGWHIQKISYINRDMNEPVAVRQFLLTNGETLDYVLFIQGKACGVVYLRNSKESIKSIYGYNRFLPKYIDLWLFPLPFIYQVYQKEIFFSNALSTNDTPFKMAHFPKPAEILSLLEETENKAEYKKSNKREEKLSDCYYAYFYVPSRCTKHLLEKLILEQGFKKYYKNCYLFLPEKDFLYASGVFLFIEPLLKNEYPFKVLIRTSLSASKKDILFQNEAIKVLTEKLGVSFCSYLGENKYCSTKGKSSAFLETGLLKMMEQNKKAFNLLSAYIENQKIDNSSEACIQEGLPLPNTFAAHLGLYYLHLIFKQYIKELFCLFSQEKIEIKPAFFQNISQIRNAFEEINKELNVFQYVQNDSNGDMLLLKLDMILNIQNPPMTTTQFDFDYTLNKLKKDMKLIETIISLIHQYIKKYFSTNG